MYVSAKTLLNHTRGEKSQYKKKKKNTRTIICNKLTNDNITTNDQHNTSIYIYIYIFIDKFAEFDLCIVYFEFIKLSQ